MAVWTDDLRMGMYPVPAAQVAWLCVLQVGDVLPRRRLVQGGHLVGDVHARAAGLDAALHRRADTGNGPTPRFTLEYLPPQELRDRAEGGRRLDGHAVLAAADAEQVVVRVRARRRVGHRAAGLHQGVELAEDLHGRLGVEHAFGGAGASARSGCSRRAGWPSPARSRDATGRARGPAVPWALSALASVSHLGERRRRVGRVEARLREGVLVVVHDGRGHGEGHAPLDAVDLPVGERPGRKSDVE